MALEREEDILRAHPGTVVGHPHQGEPPLFQLDLHLASARVERVLHELLHDRGGPLHHLACRDLVDEPGGENLDARHALSLSRVTNAPRPSFPV